MRGITIGIDLAKNEFQAYAVDGQDVAVIRRSSPAQRGIAFF